MNEGKTPKTLVQTKLPYAKDDLEPSKSEDTIKYHYGKLYKAYVTRFNDGEGDADFNEAGAFLHDLYFTQFQFGIFSYKSNPVVMTVSPTDKPDFTCTLSAVRIPVVISTN